MKNLIFDKKFVVAALIIAVFYTGLVIFINNLIGKEAAGVAGVALTAIASVIFKQFESLRFKEVTENAVEIVYKFSWWQVLILSFFFAGLNFYFQDIKDYLLPLITQTVKYDPNNVPMWRDFAVIDNYGSAIMINHYSIWEKTVACLTFFIGAMIAAKSFPKISYGVVITACVIGIMLDFIREDLMDFVFHNTTTTQMKNGLAEYRYSFLYIIATLIGVYISTLSWKSKPSKRLQV